MRHDEGLYHAIFRLSRDFLHQLIRIIIRLLTILRHVLTIIVLTISMGWI